MSKRKCEGCWLATEEIGGKYKADCIICKIDLKPIDYNDECKFTKFHRILAILFDSVDFL